MHKTTRNSARMQLLLIALVFFGPLLVAAWLYYGGHMSRSSGGTNHGALLEPIVNLGDELPDSELLAHDDGQWLLLYVTREECGADCKQALYTTRQLRAMLGRDTNRMTRVFLRGETPPDTVFLTAEHPDLITIEDASLSGLLNNKRPENLPAGGYYLIDPLGNLVMYFRPDIDPSDMVDDIEHLLRLSRIG